MRRTCTVWQWRIRLQTSRRTNSLPPYHSCQPGLKHTAHSVAGANPSREAAKIRGWLHLVIGASGGAACGGLAAIGLGLGQPTEAGSLTVSSTASLVSNLQAPSWVSALSDQPGIITALEIDNDSSHKGPMSADHWFSSLVKHHHVRNLVMLYHSESQQFFSVLTLGKDVCGYPSIVHGGLTAATFDETFGGLLFALKDQRLLPFWGPAFTAQLDISYISRISADRTILCTAEVESIDGRKVWMRAVMSDGPQGKVYATARALFVAPKPHRLLRDVAKMITSASWLGSGNSAAE